jgi:hypothetical protein
LSVVVPLLLALLPLPLVPVVLIRGRRRRGRLRHTIHLVDELVGLRDKLGCERAWNASVVDLGLRLSSKLVRFVRGAADVALVDQARDRVAAVREL